MPHGLRADLAPQVVAACATGCAARAPPRGALPTHFGALEERVSALQREIDALSKSWASAYSKLDAAYWNAHSVRHINIEDSKVLEEQCGKLRDLLDRASEAKRVCSEAQNDGTSGLPSLFRKRATDPDRFRKFQRGEIRGCVEYDSAGKESAVPCTCPTGDEKAACQDALDRTGHELYCTHILNSVIPDLGLAAYFKHGGACNIDGSEDFLKPVIPPSTFNSIKLSVTGLAVVQMLAAADQSLPTTALRARPSSVRRARQAVFLPDLAACHA